MDTRKSIARNAVGPERLTASLRSGKYCLETFMGEPLCYKKGTLTFPAGTSADECIVDTGKHRFEYQFVGDATDAFVPTLASEGGYNWVLTTATLDRGLELIFGGLKEGHHRNFRPSSENFFARIYLITDDASGVDLTFGIKKVGAYVQTLTEFTDMAAIRILGDSSSTAGAFSLVTVLNNAGATDYTSTTPVPAVTGLEDATAVELEIRVIGRVVQFFVNGIQTGGITYTIDSGDIVSVFFRAVQTTDIAAQIKTMAYEQGIFDADPNKSDRQQGLLSALAGTTT